MAGRIKGAIKKIGSAGNEDLDGISQEVFKRRWWALIAVCIAELGVMLANSSLNLALPSLSLDLGLAQSDLTWIVSIYTLIFASFLFIAGALGDRYGRKLALQAGLLVFTLGSLYAAFFASSSTGLIAARAVMGIGSALVLPTTLSIINASFPRKQRAQAVAIWSAVAGMGMMIGSIVSGVILEFSTWHSLFLFSSIVALVSLILNQIVILPSRDEEQQPVDWLGGVLTVVGLFGVVYGITEAPVLGLGDHWVLTGLIAGSLALVVFVWWEKRVKFPMLDMKLFSNRAFSVSSITLTLTFLALMGVFFSMSQIQQLILGFTPLQASFAMIPVMLPMMIVSPMVPKVVEKFGSRLTISAGLLITSFAFVLMSLFWTADMTYWQLLAVGLVLISGIATAMTPGTNILMASVPRNRSGMGSAMNDTTRELGAALGVAILGSILASVYKSEIAETAAKFPAEIRAGLESSLAVALRVGESLGPAGASVVEASKVAWMNGVEASSIVAAVILLTSSVIAFVFLPKKDQEEA